MHVMHRFMHVADGTGEDQDKVKIWLKVKTMKIPFDFRTCGMSTHVCIFGIIPMGDYMRRVPSPHGGSFYFLPHAGLCEVI